MARIINKDAIEMANWILREFENELTDWEVKFLNNVIGYANSGRFTSLSIKQSETMQKIYRRLA